MRMNAMLWNWYSVPQVVEESLSLFLLFTRWEWMLHCGYIPYHRRYRGISITHSWTSNGTLKWFLFPYQPWWWGGGGNKSYLVVSHPLWQWVGLVLFWESMWGENNLKLDFLCLQISRNFLPKLQLLIHEQFFCNNNKKCFEYIWNVTNFYERRV